MKLLYYFVIFRIITHVSSAPQLHSNNSQTVSSDEQRHAIELLQREPLPTLSSSK